MPELNASSASAAIPESQISRGKRIVWGVASLLLLLHAGLAIDCARRLTVTHDEYWHLPVGLLNLSTGRFDYDNLNPPLIRMWAALPLLFTAAVPTDVDQLDAIGHGDAFLAANRENYRQIFTLGRGMIVLLSVLTGVVLTLWASELFGNGAALLTALLWSASPTLLMNAALVTTDLGAACCFVLTLYAVWKHAQSPSWKRAGLVGLLLGLSQMVKFTSILLYPLAIASWLLFRFRNPQVVTYRARALTTHWAILLVLSLLVWNGGYLFRGSCTPLNEYTFQSKTLSALSARMQAVSRLPVPLPRDYLEGLDRQRRIMESEHPVFLDGQWSTTGFPHYYLMALWYKLPHAFQLLTTLTLLFLFIPGRQRRTLRVQTALLLPIVALPAIASGSGMQLGIRYLLPMLPFLILFAAQAGRWFDWTRYRFRSALIGLLAVAALGSLRHHPHHLAYFNEWAGGPANGHNHLLDSNIDWGQDLDALRDYLEKNDIQNPGIAYFGTFPPSALGIDYHLPPSRSPRPGWYAISTNFRQSRPHIVRRSDDSIHPVDFGAFAYFRSFEPQARIGYSIWIYQIPDLPPRR